MSTSKVYVVLVQQVAGPFSCPLGNELPVNPCSVGLRLRGTWCADISIRSPTREEAGAGKVRWCRKSVAQTSGHKVTTVDRQLRSVDGRGGVGGQPDGGLRRTQQRIVLGIEPCLGFQAFTNASVSYRRDGPHAGS